MRSPNSLSVVLLTVIGLTTVATHAADPISTWVDAEGVRHFSQYPPADSVAKSTLLEAEPMSSTQLHTWVDSKGVRHFSQNPPAGSVAEFAVLELQPITSTPAPDDRVATMRALARELELAREARTAARTGSEQPSEPAPRTIDAWPDRDVMFLPYPYRAYYPPRYGRPPHKGIAPYDNGYRPQQPSARIAPQR